MPSTRRRSLAAIAWDLVREPMLLLLIACSTVYLFLGDAREAWLLAGSIAVVIGIELYQAQKTERALEALRDLSAPRALVIRDGARQRIPGREVVRGDLVVLAEGDRVPADGVVREAAYLLIDESLLTGESVAVRKAAGAQPQADARPGGEETPWVFAGTLVVGGEGVAEVTAAGARTAMGRIGTSLQHMTPDHTLVQRETRRLVRFLGGWAALLCVLVVALHGLTRGNWLHGLLAGLTLAIALVPEELPVILTVFLALGAWRISRRQVLTRRVPAVEMLGAATVLCTDKTGTLTMNRMAVQRLWAGGAFHHLQGTEEPFLPGAFQELAAAGILASRRYPVDPMEQALHELAGRVQPEALRRDWELVNAYPFSRALLAVASVWRSPDGQRRWAMAKGAPEGIVRLCRVEGPAAQTLLAAASAMAAEGLRVLGVARSRIDPGPVAEDLRALSFECLGLVGLADPVRPSVPEAIQECRQAGIRVIMVTGDYPATARHIARSIGIVPHDAVLTGAELEGMDHRTLEARIREVSVCARIVPEQKLRLVEALKANGEIVAMTGDGVNDAPALKAAHIGIAMGLRGTDVAREASDLVLLNDDFSSIVQAVRLGRRIFDNLKKAIAYIFAVHVPIAGMALLPVMLGWPLVLLPVHVVFLELIIDPACSIAFEAEPEEADVMRRPPRRPEEQLFGRRAFVLSLLRGAGALLVVWAVLALALGHGKGISEARAMTFTSLVAVNLGLIFASRSWSRPLLEVVRQPNPALWWIAAAALVVLGLVVYVPVLQEVFQFAPLHPNDLGWCLLAVAVGMVWCELLKHASRRRRARTPNGVEGQP